MLIGAVALAVSGWTVFSSTGDLPGLGSQRINPSLFIPEKFFAAAKTIDSAIPCDETIRAGITSHHDLASPLIRQFFDCVSHANQPSTIILIGPNHFHAGNRAVLTARQNWETPFGVLETDAVLVDALFQSDLVEINDSAVAEDHAAALMMPYLKSTFPRAKVVPLLLLYSLEREDIAALRDLIRSNSTDTTLIIGAIDFSHYQAREQAARYDAETEKFVREFDIDTVLRQGDEHFDSAPGLALILSLFDARTEASLIDHADSSDFGASPAGVTTYFNWIFTRS